MSRLVSVPVLRTKRAPVIEILFKKKKTKNKNNKKTIRFYFGTRTRSQNFGACVTLKVMVIYSKLITILQIWNNRRKESTLVILPSRISQQGKFLFLIGLGLLFTSGGVIEESKSLCGEEVNDRGGDLPYVTPFRVL